MTANSRQILFIFLQTTLIVKSVVSLGSNMNR